MNPKPISFEIDPVCVPFDKNGEEREQQAVKRAPRSSQRGPKSRSTEPAD